MKHIIIALSIALFLSACSERKPEKFSYNFGSPKEQTTDTKSDSLPLALGRPGGDPLSVDNPSSYKYLLKNSSNDSSLKKNSQSPSDSGPKLELIQPKNGETLKDSERYLSQFYKCANTEAKKYARLNETVESIAKVAVSSCESLVYKAMKSNIYWLNSSPSGKVSAIAQIKRNGESVALKSAMDARLQN
ncbi:hypothetical protein [Serratia marcescens]|uniref:hypothetical protein n=1 Tax=Serratia marcescens TaxID=615 RepID=UPI000744DC12|nr:hypothetical protein [Serratia marcescens]CVA23035.1 Uncharacterised protein [Serratia marcescens]